MNDWLISLIIYGIPLLGVLAYYRKSRSRKLEATIRARKAAEEGQNAGRKYINLAGSLLGK